MMRSLTGNKTEGIAWRSRPLSDRTSTALAATDWEALADERYLMEQDILGPREQVDVQHLLIESEDRSFAELMSRTWRCRPGSMRARLSLPWL
ncbi:MAG: hypothetical protein CM15mP74_20450 [Halieaceae bacterium]|nr:MAG: hypothetical protein CM15mP74_20450 [Halieaceae bacterium]